MELGSCLRLIINSIIYSHNPVYCFSPPYIAAIHNTENNMIHVLAAETDGSKKEMDLPYLPVLIQRHEGEPLAGSMELDY